MNIVQFFKWIKRSLGFHVHNWGRWEIVTPERYFQYRICKICGYIQEKPL